MRKPPSSFPSIRIPTFIQRIWNTPLHERYLLRQPMLLSRKDTRPINLIIQDQGFRGRDFRGGRRDLENYLLTNRPKIGFGSMANDHILSLIAWESHKSSNNIHAFVTSPANRIIDALTYVIDHNVGSTGEVMSSQLSAAELAGEKEMIVLGDVLPAQFVASIVHEHFERLKEGKEVPNQLVEMGVDVSAPKKVKISDFSNLTAMLKACLDQQCFDKASMIAAHIEPEQLRKEASTNNYSASAIEELQKFADEARSVSRNDEAFSPKGFRE